MLLPKVAKGEVVQSATGLAERATDLLEQELLRAPREEKDCTSLLDQWGFWKHLEPVLVGQRKHVKFLSLFSLLVGTIGGQQRAAFVRLTKVAKDSRATLA